MVLHLSIAEQQTDEPKIHMPAIGDWSADMKEQIITHIESGCRFRAYPVQRDGPVVPFATKQIAVRFVGMTDRRPAPSLEKIMRLGTQGILWAVTYTLAMRP